MKKIFIPFSALLIVLLAVSCEKDKKAEIPSYLSIGEITVKDSAGNVVSSDAEDAWIYIDDKLKGVFQLPTKLPVLEEGVHQLDIRPGVNENGVYDLKVKYLFYEPYSQSLNLKDGEITTIDPVVTYADFAKINTSWPGADFEGGINFNRSTISDTFFVQTPNNTGSPVYGNTVGTYYLTDEKPIFEAYTDPIADVPRNDPEVWIEMDYISDVHVEIGLYQGGTAPSNRKRLVIFKPQSTWTKVYIKLAAGILTFPTAPNYRFYILSVKDNTLSTSVTSIDNVKLLHF